MLRNNFRYILFDADGTLFDFPKAERVSYFNSFAESGLESPSERLYQRYHEINQSLWEKLELGQITKSELAIERHRMTFDEFHIKCSPDLFNTLYLKHLGESDYLYDGAFDMCSQIRQILAERFGDNPQGFSLCIITNGIESVQFARFNKSKIHSIFDKIYISEAIGCPKPDKRYFDFVFNDLKIIDKSEVLVVGDSLTSDIQGANNCGVASCWYNPRKLMRSGNAVPTFTVCDFNGIVDLFRE